MEQSDGWVDVYAAAYFTEARALAGEGAFEEACDVIARARRVAARRRLRQLDMLADLCSIELQLSQGAPRSEEHTSELQSLMRISYAVFCLYQLFLLRACLNCFSQPPS